MGNILIQEIYQGGRGAVVYRNDENEMSAWSQPLFYRRQDLVEQRDMFEDIERRYYVERLLKGDKRHARNGKPRVRNQFTRPVYRELAYIHAALAPPGVQRTKEFSKGAAYLQNAGILLPAYSGLGQRAVKMEFFRSILTY